MYFNFILKSYKDGINYSGFTRDLKLRIKQHNDGLVQSTKHRKPLELIYYEAGLNGQDAKRREKYFKTHYGRMFLRKRFFKQQLAQRPEYYPPKIQLQAIF